MIARVVASRTTVLVLVLVLVVVALTLGCDGEDVAELERLGIQYETPEVEVATAFSEPLCRGDLAWLDLHTKRVESLLGVAGETLRTAYVYDPDAILVPVDGDENAVFIKIPGCPRNLSGCYHRDERIAIGVPHSLPHELGHSVSNDLDPSYERFWYEGLAEALSEHPIVYQAEDLVAAETSDDVMYAVPAHFIRWLIQEQGIEPVLRVFEGEDFFEVYGVTLASMEQVYDMASDDVMPSPFACADEPIVPTVDGSFEVATELDCSSDATTRLRHGSSFDRIGTIRIVSLESEGTYVVDAEGLDLVRIGGCQSVPGDLVEELGDVVNDASPLAPFNPPFTTVVEPGQELFLPAGKYRVVLIAAESGDPKPISFSLSPA